MMSAKLKEEERKHFYIRSYRYLTHLEEVTQKIRKNSSKQLQVSVLGKLSQNCLSRDKDVIKDKRELEQYWNDSLGPKSGFGLFCNPEIGTLFIAGALVSQFLHNMNGKVLGEMHSGPYGILRGLGITEKNASTYLKDLNENCFLLILRGYPYEMTVMEELIENQI